MSLLIDDDVVKDSDLQAIEPELSDIADACSITIDGDAGIIRQSWNESADELMEAMQAFGGDIIAWPGTLTTYGAFGINRPRVRLNQIVVNTPWGARTSPLQRWLIYRALTLLYRECLNRTDKDRYEKKWNRAKDALTTAWSKLWANGLPYVSIPLEAPGAVHAYYAGEWSATNLSLLTQGTSDAQTVFVAITWVDQNSGYVGPTNKNNGESGPSQVLSIDVPANCVVQVSILGLNPPGPGAGGVIQPPRGIADGPYITRAATGWNVYAGTSATGMLLQNPLPIPLNQFSYTIPSPIGPGAVLLPGQVADANYTFQKMLQRG